MVTLHAVPTAFKLLIISPPTRDHNEVAYDTISRLSILKFDHIRYNNSILKIQNPIKKT